MRSRKLFFLFIATAIIFSGAYGIMGVKAQKESRTSLSDDPSIGKVIDREGIASIRPVLQDRWSVAEENLKLEKGDLARTGTRGANALALRMVNGAQFILGPDTLIELRSESVLKLFHGEIEITAPEGATVAVVGFKEEKLEVQGVKIVRSRGDLFTILSEPPGWLSGYKNNASTEAMGSLLANVDGRNLPLDIGYHKVTVDIRDQIARTEIEESFINNTNSILEGVFYFPLPQDASISGFAMWIGDEMVEADIVEKQRAREIYETILRERRDPGLLEWNGGNIFKARVFPIGYEKRIKITYVQVLPKTGNVYRYNYSLASEKLRLHPLKKLQIDVKISSIENISSVASASHNCKIEKTANSARIEFNAEEYSPDRDFEIEVETAPLKNNLTIAEHKRGDDGYFMLLVNAPQEKTSSSRPVIANSAPKKFIIIADTSGSVAGAQRDNQIAFIEAFLSSLSEKDSFNLMTCDVDARRAFDGAVANTQKNRDAALKFLEERYPLGWSDLENAFASVMGDLDSETHVVYVGDGITTVGDADPVALSKRLQQIYRGIGAFHAVAPGSSFESVVLRAMAGLGGGTMRNIGAADPSQTAFQLLKEILSPSIKDLKIIFTGIDAAAVYPEVLPNLPAGSQQVVIGRFNPMSANLSGKVSVTGLYKGKKIRYSLDLNLAGAEEGNSFIPRLWARQHLDYLLSQGSSEQVKSKIIALSEEYQIITPYTSFLVLESDADRERFKVRRGFRMRGGEEFFTAGRDKADFELKRKQMIEARLWRTELQTQALESLMELDRPLTYLLARQGPQGFTVINENWSGEYSGPQMIYSIAAEGAQEFSVVSDNWSAEYGRFSGAIDGVSMTRSGINEFHSGGKANYVGDSPAPPPPAPAEAGADEEIGESDSIQISSDLDDNKEALSDSEPTREKSVERLQLFANLSKPPAVKPSALSEKVALKRGDFSAEGRVSGWKGEAKAQYGGRVSQQYNPFDYLFPRLNPAVQRAGDPEWPTGVLEIAKAINRRTLIESSDKSFRIAVKHEYRDHRGRIYYRLEGESLLSSDSWCAVSSHVPGNDFVVEWFAGNERGTINASWLLGRVRKAEKSDVAGWIEPIPWYFGDALSNQRGYKPEINRLDSNRTALTLQNPNQPGGKKVLIIDSAKSAVIEVRNLLDDKVLRSTVYSDFIEAGGVWWPQSSEEKDADGDTTQRSAISVTALSTTNFAEALAAELKLKKDAIILSDEIEKIENAKQSAAEGKGRIEDYWKLLRYFAASQRWDKADVQFQSIEKLVPGRRGLDLIKIVLYQSSRRNEQLKDLLKAIASDLAKNPREAERAVASGLFSYSNSLNQGNERLELAKILKPVYERGASIFEPMKEWDQHYLASLYSMNRPDETFAKQEEMFAKYPFDPQVLTTYAQALGNRGETDAAINCIKAAINKKGPWLDHELQQFRSAIGAILINARRLEDFVGFTEELMKSQSEPIDSYVLGLYLSSLMMLDREEKASRLLLEWLNVCKKEKLDPADANRFYAAAQTALGQNYYYSNRIDDRYVKALADASRCLIDRKTEVYLTQQIIQNVNFIRTDQGRALQIELFRRLQKEISKLPPQVIAVIVNSISAQGNNVHGAASDEVKNGLRKAYESIYSRWEKEENKTDKQILAGLILRYGDSELKLKLYRKDLFAASTKAEKSIVALNLFAALLAEKWTMETQTELLQLLPQIASGEEKSLDFNVNNAILSLHRFTDWLQAAKSEAIVSALPNVNEMPRKILKAEREKALNTARSEAVKLFLNIGAEYNPEVLRPWIAIERLCLEIKLKADPQKIRSEVMLLLAPILERSSKRGRPEIPLADHILASRALAELSYLAVSERNDESAKQLIAIMDKAIAEKSELLDWQTSKYKLLVALDRGDELEAVLKEWYGKGDDFSVIRWGRSYAYILAERNLITEAAGVFEEIEKKDELYYGDYRRLSDWYAALNLPEKARSAKIRSWEVVNENTVSQSLNGELSKYNRSGNDIPSELDAEVPIKFTALMRKSQYPANYIYLLNSFYQATKDYRLPAAIAEAVPGQSAQKIYPLLVQFRSSFSTIFEEASADSLQKQIALLHAGAKSDTDRRALRLLEFIVERRAADQANGSGPHTTAALRALREAYKGEWLEGEMELMAGLLANEGALRPASLADEQIRQLSDLHRRSDKGSYARFVIAGHLASAEWANGRREAAITDLASAISEFRQANGGALPQTADSQISVYCSYLESMGAHAAAEKFWLGELELSYNSQRKHWLKRQLYSSYRNALAAGKPVSLGSGVQLYRAVHKLLLNELNERTNEGLAGDLLGTLCEIWHTSDKQLKYAEVKSDITDFAFRAFPAVLKMYDYRNGQSMISNLSYRLNDIAGPVTTLEFLIERAENEPRRLRIRNEDFWNNHAYRLAQYRSEASDKARHLESRLLALVLQELREDLRARVGRNTYFYHISSGYYWSEKSGDFARVAREVLAEKSAVEPSITYIANYLYNGLHLYGEAINALSSAYGKEILGIEGKHQLCRYLQERDRYKESIPILAKMIEAAPERLEFRAMLMKGFFHTGDEGMLVKTLTDADKFFRGRGPLQEQTLTVLGTACLETHLYRESAVYYKEAIALHVKNSPQRGIGDGVLSMYYNTLSAAYSGLDMTAEAVDAAAGAIIAWGSNRQNRSYALNQLKDVLSRAKDLDSYAAKLDQEIAKTGLENPIVRKAIGEVYLRNGQFAKAESQLRLAVENQPNDAETHRLLAQTYDKLNRPDRAVAQLLELAKMLSREIKIYEEIGNRWIALKRSDDAERAFTNIVEMTPNESEGHEALAKIRESQNRWEEASLQWREVVRVRTKEPTGYLGLARALIKLKRRDEARQVTDELLRNDWPERFGDVKAQAREMQTRLQQQ